MSSGEKPAKSSQFSESESPNSSITSAHDYVHRLHYINSMLVKKANFRQERLTPQTFHKQRTWRPKSRLQSCGVTFYIRTSVHLVNGIFHRMVLQGGDLSTTGTERVSPRGGFRRRRVPRSVTRWLDISPTGL